MRRIILSTRRNIFCLVDDEDYEWVMQWQWNWAWHKSSPWKFYAKRNVGCERSTIYLHRALMLHFDPVTNLNLIVDHENGQSLDNRRKVNLRWFTKSQNRRNRVLRSNIPKLRKIEQSEVTIDIPF